MEQPAAIAQDTRWCPVTLLPGNTGSCSTPALAGLAQKVTTNTSTQKLTQSSAATIYYDTDRYTLFIL